MLAHAAMRALAAIVIVAAVPVPVLAQTALGPYAPADAKYRVTTSTKTRQDMMGQVQEFESNASQLLSLSVAKAGAALALTMTLDSVTFTTTSPEPAPDMAETLGMRFAGVMALDGKVASSTVSDRAGAPSTSQFASEFRSILPRLMIGATTGATWSDSSSYASRANDTDLTTATVTTYTLAGDTVVAGMRAWKILGTSTSKVSGHGNRMGTDYSLAGDVKGLVTAVVSTTGVLWGETSDSDANLTVTVEAAGMTIPIAQKTLTRLEKLP